MKSILFSGSVAALQTAFASKGLDLHAELANGFTGFNALTSESALEKAFSEDRAQMEAAHAAALAGMKSEHEAAIAGLSAKLEEFSAKETEHAETVARMESEKASLCAEALKQDRQTPSINPNVEGAQDHVAIWKAMSPGKEKALYYEQHIKNKKQEG